MSKVTYIGDLRTEACHIQSGISIVTDAPVIIKERRGISPTDLIATA